MAVTARTTLFLSNKSQAVRLPKTVAFAADVHEVWDDFFEEPGIDLGDRNQRGMQARDAF